MRVSGPGSPIGVRDDRFTSPTASGGRNLELSDLVLGGSIDPSPKF